MFRGAWEIANEFGDTGIQRVRTILIYCVGYLRSIVSIRVSGFLHWLRGDLDEWLDDLDAEINKRG